MSWLEGLVVSGTHKEWLCRRGENEVWDSTDAGFGRRI